MAQQHIAIFPLIGKGHLYPTIELCSVLAARGYKVTCVVEKRVASHFIEAGAEPITFEVDRSLFQSGDEEKLLGHPHDPAWWEHLASATYPGLLRLAAATLEQVEGRYRKATPDLIVYDRLAFAGRILATQLGVSAVQISAHFAYFNDCMHRERGICVNPVPMLAFAKTLDAFMLAHGVETANNLWHVEELNIHFIPREFQHHADSFDQRFVFVGACINRPFKPIWRGRSDDKPIILISDVSSGFGTHDFFRLFIEALSGSDYHIVLSIDSGSTDERLQCLPSNFEVSHQASHLEILQHASLAICHAGAGSTLEAIYNGVPVLVSPPFPPAAEIAYRVIELGLGVSIPRSELTNDSIRRTVNGLLTDPDIQARVRQMRDAFRASGGAKLAADTIERFCLQKYQVTP